MDHVSEELQRLVRGLRCDRCGEWPAAYDPVGDAILCEGCVPVRRAFRARLAESLAGAELVVEDHENG